MKNLIKLLSLGISFMILAVILNACKKHEVPTLTTAEVTNITGTSATSGGIITDEGSGTVVERGIYWSKGITPTIADNLTVDGGGAGKFVSNMTNLEAATTYYVRAYAKNEAGTGYGMVMSFSTLGQAPIASTQDATNVSKTDATLNATVNANYVSTTVSFEYGTTTGYGNIITASPDPVNGSTNTNVTADISSLSPKTIYHYRIKAVNSLGTTYGNDMIFTTFGLAPTDGLVGYYPFNGNANDLTVNGNYGTVSGAMLTQDRFGNPNSAYYFDGINDDITGTTNNWPYSKSPRTISLWGRLKTLPSLTNGFFITYGQGTDSHVNSVYFQYYDDYRKTVVYAGYLNDINVLFNYSLNTWYNIVVTFDGTMAAIYIDGTLIEQENKSAWNTLSANFHFGNFDNWTSWLNGEVDDIRIYNRVLSQDEILHLYYEIP